MGGEGGQGHQDSRLTVPKTEPLAKKRRLRFAEATSRADSYWVPAAMESQWQLEWVCWKE